MLKDQIGGYLHFAVTDGGWGSNPAAKVKLAEFAVDDSVSMASRPVQAHRLGPDLNIRCCLRSRPRVTRRNEALVDTTPCLAATALPPYRERQAPCLGGDTVWRRRTID